MSKGIKAAGFLGLMVVVAGCSAPTITINGATEFPSLEGATSDDLVALSGGNIVSRSIGIDDIAYDLESRTTTTGGTLRINGKAQDDLSVDLLLTQGKFVATTSREGVNAPKKVLLSYGNADGVATVAASNGLGSDEDFFTATYSRIGKQTMPVKGGARFDGDYAGVYGAGRDTISGVVSGDVFLYADFANANVSGTISNRELKGVTSGVKIGDMKDVTLNAGALSNDGLFSGTTASGALDTAGWRHTTGNYEGLITGDAREQTYGALKMDHETTTGQKFDELGVFHAKK